MLPVVHPIGYPSPLTLETSSRAPSYAEKALQDALLGRHESLWIAEQQSGRDP